MRETKPEWLCMPKKSHYPGGQHRWEYKPFNGPNRSHRVSSEGIQLAIDHGRIKDFSGLLKWSAILITIFECGQSSKRPAELELMVPNGDAPLWKWKLCKFHFVNPCWLLCRWGCACSGQYHHLGSIEKLIRAEISLRYHYLFSILLFLGCTVAHKLTPKAFQTSCLYIAAYIAEEKSVKL